MPTRPSLWSGLLLLSAAVLVGATAVAARSEETFDDAGAGRCRNERDDSKAAFTGTIVVGPAERAAGEAAEPSGVAPDATSPDASSPDASDAGAASTGTARVAIVDRAFAPLDVAVAAGDTVEWTNRDGEGHTVSATSGAFDSGILPEGATFSQVFETPGTYDYVCAVHPEMRATVTVTEPASPAAASAIPTPVASSAAITEAAVAIADMVYDPARVEVSAGAVVRWTNDDAVVHTVTARDGSFNSGILRTGDEFSLTFDAPGTYDYFCAIHPLQGGQVVVTGPGA